MHLPRMTIAFALAASLAGPAAVTGAVAAEDAELVTGASLELILAALKDNDFTVELSKDDEGDPIKSTEEGVVFSIRSYGCDDEGKNCEFIQFAGGWDMTGGVSLAKVEEWNQTKVFGQAFRDDDKDPWLALAVNLKGGVSQENFSGTVDWWRELRGDFEKHIGFKK